MMGYFDQIKGYLGQIMWLIVWLILFVIILIIIYLINGGSMLGFNEHSNVLVTNQAFNNTPLSSNVRGFSIDMVIIFASAFALSAIIWIIFWMFIGINKTVILPFYTNVEKLNEKAISDIMLAELQRIKKIHNSSLKIPFRRSERLPVPPENLDSIILKELDAASQDISDSLKEVGKLSFSGLELQIGNMVMALNQHRVIRKNGYIIHGSLHQDTSQIYMECHIKNKRGIINCEIKQKITEGSLLDIIRDMAFKISYELQEDKTKNNKKKDKKNSDLNDNKCNHYSIGPAHASKIFRTFFNESNIIEIEDNINKLKEKLKIRTNNKCPEGVRVKYFFNQDDINSPKVLAKKLSKISKKIDLKEFNIQGPYSDDHLDNLLKKKIAKELNRLIKGRSLYNYFDPSCYRQETKCTKKRCEAFNKGNENCFHLNRLILEDVYLQEIKKFNENSIKSWEELKYFTEALNNYNQYIKTEDKRYLNDAYKFCNSKALQIKDTIFRSMFYNIGICYFDLSENEKANDMFQRAAAITPMVNAYCGSGICLKYLQQFTKAMDAFRRAVCYDWRLETPAPWYLLGSIYLDLGCYAYDLYDYAIAAYCEAIKIDENYPYPWMYLGITYYRKAATEKWNGSKYNSYAIKFIGKAIDLARDFGLKEFPTQPVVLAVCLLQSGREEDKMAAQQILSSSSLYDEYNAACLESIRNNFSESENHLKKALESRRTNIIQALFDPDLSAFFSTPHSEKLLDHYHIDDSIVEDIRKLLMELHKEDYYILASFEAVCGKKERAIQHLKKAFEEYKENRGKLSPDRFEQDQHFNKIHNIALIINNDENPIFDVNSTIIKFDIKIYNTCRDEIEDIWVKVKRSDSDIPTNLLAPSLENPKNLKFLWDCGTIPFIYKLNTIDTKSRTFEIDVTVKGKNKKKGVEVINSEHIIISIKHRRI